MDHEMMRLRCLELAMSEGLKGHDATRRAAELFEFLRSGTTPTADKPPPPPARVVGRDGDLEGPFKDYLKE
jgi:hypothetical protein